MNLGTPDVVYLFFYNFQQVWIFGFFFFVLIVELRPLFIWSVPGEMKLLYVGKGCLEFPYVSTWIMPFQIEKEIAREYAVVNSVGCCC